MIRTFLFLFYSYFCLKDKSPPRRVSNTTLAQVVRWVRSQARGVPAPALIWTLLACSATFCLLRGLHAKNKPTERSSSAPETAEKTSDHADAADAVADSSDHLEEKEKHETEEEDEEEGANSEDEAEKSEKDNVSENEDEDEENDEKLDECFK